MQRNDIEYLIFEDKGVVVCKIWNCMYAAIRRIFKYTGDERNLASYKINDLYLGVARCSSEDTFDLEYGKKLALKRAKQNRRQAINYVVRKYMDHRKAELNTLEARSKVIR